MDERWWWRACARYGGLWCRGVRGWLGVARWPAGGHRAAGGRVEVEAARRMRLVDDAVVGPT
eukprot:scaffold129429_cov63-Phaeocystis_antarctica.AAC.2